MLADNLQHAVQSSPRDCLFISHTHTPLNLPVLLQHLLRWLFPVPALPAVLLQDPSHPLAPPSGAYCTQSLAFLLGVLPDWILIRFACIHTHTHTHTHTHIYTDGWQIKGKNNIKRLSKVLDHHVPPEQLQCILAYWVHINSTLLEGRNTILPKVFIWSFGDGGHNIWFTSFSY